MENIEDYRFRCVKEYPPRFNELFWAFNAKEKHVFLAKRERIEVDPKEFSEFYTLIDGFPYYEDHKITAQTRLEDDFVITHWAKLPPLKY